MPTTPYAKLLVSVNGGAPTSGGITVVAGDTIDLSAESTVGWTQQRYEIWSGMALFPLTVPAGWSTDGTTGAFYYSTSSTPPSFVIPAGWGKLLLRLRVNNGADGTTLCDDSTALQTLSPTGLYDIAWGETSQFSTAEKWIAAWRDDLRLFEAVIGGSVVPASRTLTAGAGLTGGGDLTANRTFNVVAANGTIVVNADSIQVGVITATEHGNLAGGALHADAIAGGPGTSGFMTGAQAALVNNATATPTASTIAKWDASKYLYAAKFNGEGTTSTAGVLNTAKNVTQLAALNNAGGADISLVTTDATDKITFGDATDADSSDVVAASFVRTLIGAAVGIYTNDKGTSFGMAPSFGSGAGVLGIVNRTTAPSANPTGGVIVSVAAGAPEVRSPNGVRTVLAPECNATSTQNDLDFIQRTVSTADATATVIVAYPDLPTNSQGLVELFVGGIKKGTDQRCAYKVLASVGRAGGGLSVDATDVQTIIDNIGVASVPSVVANTNAFDVKVTGKAATDIDWHINGRVAVYSK